MDVRERGQRMAPNDNRGTSRKQRLRAETLPSNERALEGDLTHVYKYLIGGSKDDRARLLVPPSNRTRGKRPQA